jgi:hypothetical protein
MSNFAFSHEKLVLSLAKIPIWRRIKDMNWVCNSIF